ncbi:MAG: IgGFc-binding protein [Enhygromyxa sp.]
MDKRLAALALVLAAACGDSVAEGSWPWPASGPQGSESGPGEGASSAGEGGGEAAEDGDADHGGPRLDLGEHGGALGGPASIPDTCARAEIGESSVGCLFYTVDMDSKSDEVPFAAVVSNVQEHQAARVSIERKLGSRWYLVAGPVAVPALSLHEFRLADFHHEGTGIKRGGAYRIVADLPIVAYQFNPIDGASSLLSDASMLYPVASWDFVNHVVNWAAPSGGSKPVVTVAAAHDGTSLRFTPSVATDAGPGVTASQAGQPILIELDAGDTVSINPVDPDRSLTGSTIVSDPDHPVAVFSGHSCANIPGDVCCCDHLEDQLSGVRLWGRDFVAAHMPVRHLEQPEATLWQIYASEDRTTVSLDADLALIGLPGARLRLNRGEVVELFVTAPPGIEADFRIRADQPIAVVGYMTGSHNLPPSLQRDGGDPAMVQFASVEQFLPRYVILVPGTWIHDALLLTRAAGASVTIDGVPVSDLEFEPLVDGEWEVARVRVSDGVHLLDGDGEPFGVVVIGWDQYDSYAYTGGTGTARLNPTPTG